MAAVALSRSTLINDANLVHYYPFDVDGTDSKGSLNLTGVNSPTFPAGKFSNDVHFVSSSSQYMNNTSGSPLSGTGDFTINFWLKTTGNSQYWHTIGGSGGTNVLFILTNASGQIELDLPGTPFVHSTTTINNGAYHMLTLTRSSNTFQWYVDGSADGSSNTNAISITNTFYYTGAFNTGTSGAPNLGGYCDGDQDDVAFFTRALSSTEISNHYNGLDALPSGGSFLLNFL